MPFKLDEYLLGLNTSITRYVKAKDFDFETQQSLVDRDLSNVKKLIRSIRSEV